MPNQPSGRSEPLWAVRGRRLGWEVQTAAAAALCGAPGDAERFGFWTPESCRRKLSFSSRLDLPQLEI